MCSYDSFMGPYDSCKTTEQEMETGQSCGSGYRAWTSQVQEMCSDLETTQGEQQAVIFPATLCSLSEFLNKSYQEHGYRET